MGFKRNIVDYSRRILRRTYAMIKATFISYTIIGGDGHCPAVMAVFVALCS